MLSLTQTRARVTDLVCFRFRKARRFSLLIMKSIKNKLLIKPGLRPNGIEVIKILNLIKSIHLSFFLNKKKQTKIINTKPSKRFMTGMKIYALCFWIFQTFFTNSISVLIPGCWTLFCRLPHLIVVWRRIPLVEGLFL